MWQPGWEESLREEWIHVYIWLSPFTVHLKSSDTVNQLYPIQKIFSKVGGWGRAGLGILEFLEVWSTLWGLMKSYDSQETNSIVKNSSKTRAAFLHTNQWWYQFAAWDDKQEPLKLQFAVSPMEWTHCLGTFPNWDSRLLLTSEFPALFNSGCWSAQIDVACTVIFLCCLYFIYFNDCILKLSQIIF